MAGLQVVALRGDVDLAVAEEVRVALEAQVASGASVVVDCSEIAFIDSRGLSALICARHSAIRAAVGFSLRDVPERMHRVLRAAGIEDLFVLAGP